MVSMVCFLLAGVGFDVHSTEDGRVLIASAYDTADCDAIHPEVECCGECPGHSHEGLSSSCCCVDDVLGLTSTVLVSHFDFSPLLPSTALFSFEPESVRNFSYIFLHLDFRPHSPCGFVVLRA